MRKRKTKNKKSKRINSTYWTNADPYAYKKPRRTRTSTVYSANRLGVFSINVCQGYSVDIHNLWADQHKLNFKHTFFSHKKRISVIAELFGL